MSNDGDGNIAATYTLIYSFLVSRSHQKVANSLRKAVKQTVILKDGLEPELPMIDEIVRQWKIWKDERKETESSSDTSQSEVFTESHDESDSENSDSSSTSIPKRTKLNPPPSPLSSSSADSESHRPRLGLGMKPQLQAITTLPTSTIYSGGNDIAHPKDINYPSSAHKRRNGKSAVEDKPESAKSGVLVDQAKYDASSHPALIPEASTPVNGKTDVKSSNELTENRKRKQRKTESDKIALDEQENSVDQSRVTVTKKRRVSMNGESMATAAALQETKGNSTEPLTRKINTPFKRIKEDEVVYYDTRLKDNSFAGRGAGANDYGSKASKDLLITRGAGFRKEKNKKKRGSYRGGEITMQSHSIKFNAD